MKGLFLGVIVGIILVLGGGYVMKNVFKFQKPEPVVEQSSDVLLEKVKTVAKLVTIEGYFSEVFDHKDYYWADISFFRKKAIIKVNGKVSVGFDMEQTVFTMRPEEKQLLISNLPDPEIISIDTDISYYDLTEGTFNNFTANELTELNAKAKELIKEKAEESDLLIKAVDQSQPIFELIELIAQEAGYEVVYDTKESPEIEPIDSLLN
ncbi:MAG: DUF4230 domain-containing protein [Bacteroidota bacterium]